jgi:DNA polymerase III epsilon subunit-like protein
MPTWQQVAPLFRAACEERVSAGYNVGFDADFVRHHHGHPRGAPLGPWTRCSSRAG